MKRSRSNIIIIAIVATTLPLLATASTVRGGGGVSNDLNTNALPNNNINNGSGKKTKKTRYDIHTNKRPAIPDDVSLVDKVRNWNIRQLEYELLNKGGGYEEEESYDHDQLPSSSSQQQQQRKLYEGLHHKKSDNGYGTISVEHAPDLGFQHVAPPPSPLTPGSNLNLMIAQAASGSTSPPPPSPSSTSNNNNNMVFVPYGAAASEPASLSYSHSKTPDDNDNKNDSTSSMMSAFSSSSTSTNTNDTNQYYPIYTCEEPARTMVSNLKSITIQHANITSCTIPYTTVAKRGIT